MGYFPTASVKQIKGGYIEMGLLRVDTNKCKKDGFCVLECPFSIIQLEGDNGYPTMVPGGEVSVPGVRTLRGHMPPWGSQP